MPIGNPLLENTNISLPYGQYGSAQGTKDSLSKTYLSTDEANELSNFFGINPFNLDISNSYTAAGSPVKTDDFGMFDYSDVYNNRGRNSSLSMGSTFGAVTGKTAAGTEYVIPQFTTEIDQGKVNRTSSNKRYQYATGKTALQAQGEALQQWYTHAREYAEAAEKADTQAAQDAQSGAFTNIANEAARVNREYFDAETVSPDETEGMFSDLAGYTGTGGGSRPEAGTGAFYDRTADQQQSTLDAYAGDTSQGVRMDPRLADATVQGQVQIRNDITGAIESVNAQSMAGVLSVLGGLGIPATLVQNADGTVSYETEDGKDLSSLIKGLSASIEDKIGGVAGDVATGLGYGGQGQDTLFSDIAGLGTAIGDVRGDIGGISTLDQQDVQNALTTQFGDLTTEIQTVGTAVGGVQTTVDDVEAAVGVLDERQLDIVQDLADLGVDTASIIDALGRVEGAVGAGGTLEGQIASKASGIQQAVSGIGGQVSSGFGNQASQISGLEGGASATALSQVAGDLGNIQQAQTAQTESIGNLATVEGQQDLANTVAQVKTATEGVDAAIKTNVIPEFENIFDIFDDQGNLLSDVETATGNIKTSVDANGNVAIEKFSNIGDAIGNIDVSNMDESAAIAALTTTIGTAASTFTEDYSSMETNIANDRKVVLEAIQTDSEALDELISTDIPQVISTGVGDYKLELGQNNELLVSKLDEAVDLSGVATAEGVADVGSAVAGQAVSLGNIDNIKGDVTNLLAKAEEDLASNTARDQQLSGVREDMLDALDDEINANEAVMRNLLAGQTQTIQGDLGDYVVSLDSQTGKLTAQAIDRQTLALGADIDAGTGQLIKDANTNTNYLERKVLEAKERVEGKIGTAFDTTGALISSGLTANGDEIERVLDAEGKLTETVIAANGTIQDTIVTDLSSVLDDTGNLNQAAIELAQQGSDIEQKQTYFNALGGLIRDDVDTMGRRITREIDSSGQFIRETSYYDDGSEAGTDNIAIAEILDKIFPSDPLAQPEDLTAADRRFLQGFRAEGLMGFG